MALRQPLYDLSVVFSGAGGVRKEEVNTGRQGFVDLAKLFAIFYMVMIHVLSSCHADLGRGVGYFFNCIGGAQFAAPVFMVSMGIGVAYSRRDTAGRMARRGGALLLAGYLLDVLRFLPVLVCSWIRQEPEALRGELWRLTEVDIFQFAGMAFLLLALLKYLGVRAIWILLLALAMSVAGSFVREIDTGSYPLNLALSLFAGVSARDVFSSFPLLNWFIFVALGLWAGQLLRRCADPDRLFLFVLPASAVLYLGYAWWAVPQRIGMFGPDERDFYHLVLRDALVCLAAVGMQFGLCQFLLKAVGDSLRAGITRISRDLPRIYVIQWLLVLWCLWAPWVLGFGWRPALWLQLALGVAILLASVLLARLPLFRPASGPAPRRAP